MADDFRLEDLLDSVADAVSALVLFASDANTDKKKLTNLQEGAKVVAASTSFFTTDAERTIRMWREFGNEQMAKDMDEACAGIREAGTDVVDAVSVLMKDDKSTEAKNRLLEAGKAILKHMVRLLQLNDLYEVTLILKQIQAVRQMIANRDSPAFAPSEFTLMSNYLSQLLTKRVKRCYDGNVKKQLDDAGVDIARAAIPMMDVQLEFMDNPQNMMLKDRREMYNQSLTFALKKAHEATRASAKSPFDLSMLDRNNDMDFDEDFVALSNANWEGGLDALQSAIKNGDEAELESALRALRKDLLSQLDAAEEAANACQDPNLRDKLLDALARLRKQLENMLDKLSSEARKALKDRDPEAIRAAIEELKKLRARVLDGLAKDNLLQHAVNIDSLMRSLLDAAKAGDAKESTAIVHDIGNEVEDIDGLISTLASNVTDDASRRQRLEEGMANLKKHLAALGQVTNQALADPNNDDLWRRLQDLMDRIRGVTNDLVNASLQTTPQELLGLSAGLEDALRRLMEAAKNAAKNPDGVSAGAANVIANLKPALELATSFAAHADPHTAAAINKAVEDAKKEAAALVGSSKDLASAAKQGNKPNMDDAFARLKDAIDRLRDCNGKLVGSAVADAEAEMNALTEQMAAAKARLAQALKDADVKGAAAAVSDFQEAVKRKVILARILAAETDDLDLRNQLLGIANDMEKYLGKDLLDSVKASLKDPKSEEKRNAAVTKFNKAMEAAQRLDQLATAGSAEEKFAANGKLLSRTAELVKLGVNDGNFSDAGNYLRLLREQLGKHRQLANQIGEHCAHDPAVAARLNGQCDQLDDIYKQIVLATKAATTDPSKKQAVADLVAKFQKVAAQSTEESKKAKASVEAEQKRVQAEAAEAARRRKLEEEEMAGKNEIFKAAHKVAQAASSAEGDMPNDGSPTSMLVYTAGKMANVMKLLAELAETTDKAAAINKAREIAALTTELHKYANLAANECSDPKLAQELRNAANVAKNFSIQLKIVCAVKASSGDDATAQKSLVTCAQSLCKNVVECVDIARVARLKKKMK